MLSSTVYDHAITRLSWRFEDMDYVVFTNADFNFLRGVSSLVTDTHDFTFFMGVGDATAANNPYRSETVPDASNFSVKRSEYTVLQGDSENEAAFAGIEALLAHYDANLPNLKIQHQRREALTAAKKRYDAANPKEPEPFIMQFWVPKSASERPNK